MENEKTNILDVLLFGSLTLLFGGMAILSWQKEQIVSGLIVTAMTVLLAYFVVNDLRKGVRMPTRWEQFKAWMTMRPVIAGGVGMLVLSGLPNYGNNLFNYLSHEAVGVLVFAFLFVWAGVMFYSLWRAPHRYESDAAYRRRVGYVEQK